MGSGVPRHVPTAPCSAPPAHDLLRALADPIRLQVVQLLAEGERCVCELTEALDLAQPRLSFHLRVMKEAGLISARQQGRWVYYRLEPGALAAVRDWLGEVLVVCRAARIHPPACD